MEGERSIYSMLRERGVSPIYNMPPQILANTKLVRSPTLKGRKRPSLITTSYHWQVQRRSDWFSAYLAPSFALHSPCRRCGRIRPDHVSARWSARREQRSDAAGHCDRRMLKTMVMSEIKMIPVIYRRSPIVLLKAASCTNLRCGSNAENMPYMEFVCKYTWNA